MVGVVGSMVVELLIIPEVELFMGGIMVEEEWFIIVEDMLGG